MGRRVGLCIVGVALASVAIAGSLRSEIETVANKDDLAAARVQVARRALERIELRRAASPVFWAEPGPDMKGIVAWSRRLMEAERDVSTTKAGRLEAIRGHVGRLEEWLTILERSATQSEAAATIWIWWSITGWKQRNCSLRYRQNGNEGCESQMGVFVSLVAPSATAFADVPSIEIDSETYGAIPDEFGPIGGGAGYTRIVTNGDFSVTTLDELLDALAKAEAGQVVFVAGEKEIDLTARIYIEGLVLEIPEGVTLASDRGQGSSKGALLSSDALKTPVMIRARGPKVRVTGLRT